ncbi:MAG: Dabb family protein, partial [Glaciimonas sp.]|nr:Dabb family protein [Glaciimonas sp.]
VDDCTKFITGTVIFEVVIAQEGLEATCDIALYSEFVSQEALDVYQNHPDHVAIKPWVTAVRESRQVIDYLS